jgi:hypothetical protein
MDTDTHTNAVLYIYISYDGSRSEPPSVAMRPPGGGAGEVVQAPQVSPKQEWEMEAPGDWGCDIAGLTTRYLKKRASSTHANITVSKKHRKLLKEIQLAQKEKAAMVVEAPSKLTRTSQPQPKRQKKIKDLQDVDVEIRANVHTSTSFSSSSFFEDLFIYM